MTCSSQFTEVMLQETECELMILITDICLSVVYHQVCMFIVWLVAGLDAAAKKFSFNL